MRIFVDSFLIFPESYVLVSSLDIRLLWCYILCIDIDRHIRIRIYVSIIKRTPLYQWGSESFSSCVRIEAYPSSVYLGRMLPDGICEFSVFYLCELWSIRWPTEPYTSYSSIFLEETEHISSIVIVPWFELFSTRKPFSVSSIRLESSISLICCMLYDWIDGTTRDSHMEIVVIWESFEIDRFSEYGFLEPQEMEACLL